jgi:hypothetical protein
VKTGDVRRKAVLLVIAEHADKNGGNSFPDQSTIAAQTELSVDSVQRYLKKLVADGILKRTRRFDRRGYRKSDCYAMDLNRNTAVLANTAELCGIGDESLSRSQPEPYTAASPNPKPQCCGLHIDEPPKEPPKKKKREKTTKTKTASRRGTKPKTTIPTDYAITDKHITEAEKIGLSEDRARAEFPRFVNYHLAKDSTSADWNASWRTWCDNRVTWDAEKQQRNGANGGPVTGPQSAFEGISGWLHKGGEEQ